LLAPDYCSLPLLVAENPKALATEIAESEIADNGIYNP
jgi:hypothetical protein